MTLTAGLTRSTDGRGNSTITGYNSLGLPETVTDPATKTQAASTWTASYDAAGNQVSLAAPGGVSTTSSFDELNRLKTQTGAGAEAPTTGRVVDYDDAGRIKTVSAPGGDITINYDDRGDVLSATGGGGNASFGYDADGRMASRTDASGTATYNYDKGRVSGVTDAATHVLQTPQYDEAGDISGILYSSGQIRTYSYDDLDRLASDTLKTAAGTVTSSIGYDYDLNDNLKQKTTTGTAKAGTSTYTYDYADRMKSWTAGGTTTPYNWDAAGNRIQAGAKTATFDERNRLLSDGDYTYTYTPRGTLASRTSSGLTENMSFDAFDRMVSDSHNTYTYDGLDRVATRNGSAMSYSGPSSALASDGTTNFSRSPDGSLLSTAQGNDKQLTVSDAHGDVVAGFQPGDGNTGLAHSTAYDPFGQVTGSSGAKSSVGFQGAYTDPDSGQVDMNARWYNPGTGTFDSRDTIAGNRYAYGDSAPMNNTDPTGHSPQTCDGRPCDSCVILVGTSHDCGGGGGSGGNGGGSSCGGSTDPLSLVGCENSPCSDSGKGNLQLESYCTGDGGSGGSGTGEFLGQIGQGGYLPGKCTTNCGSHGGSSRPAPPDPAIAARAAERRAAENNPIPIPSAMSQPFYAQQSEVVSTTPDLPAQQVSQLQNPVSDIDKSYAAMQAKLVADQGPVVQNVSASMQQASDSSSNFWGDVGDAAAAAGKFVWDAGVDTVMDAYHCLHSMDTTLGIALAHGRWQPNNGYGPEYEDCLPTAFNLALLGLGPEVKLGAEVAPEILDGLLAGGQKMARGIGSTVGPWLGGLADSAINGIPGLKDLLGKAKNDLTGMMCTLFNSFAASTPVEMADGSQKPISEVKVGDQVLATDPTTGQSADKPVTDVIVGQGLKHLVDVGVADNGATSSVTATDNHPFWVDNLSEWVDAGQLAIGEKLRTDDGREVTVAALHRHDETTKVYNLTVDSTHTYYVGVSGTSVLVHNGGGCTPDFVQKTQRDLANGYVTSGRIFTSDGKVIAGAPELSSGKDVLSDAAQDLLAKSPNILNLPKNATYMSSEHVETKYAVWMKENKITDATVVVNQTFVCGGPLSCQSAVAAILPRGSTMTVWFNGGTEPVVIGGVG
jgi:RHS repeat-associated protein